MATYGPIYTKTYPASGDLSSYQFHFLTAETDEQVALAGTGSVICGIQQNDPSVEGQGTSVAYDGFSLLVVDGTAGGGIAVGDKLSADATGHGVVTTTDLDDYGAVAQEASTAAGDLIRVLVTPNGLISAS